MPNSAVRVRRPARWPTVALLGPAFVAAVAYVDPGNVAANLTSGAKFGYLLVWVLVAANAVAVLVQYQSAKLGIVTGRSLPELLGDRLSAWPRRAFWVQAELVALATDLAEVVGGAIALQLLFGLPLPVGGAIVGLVSMAVLLVQSRHGQRPFERVVVGMLGVITLGFLTGLVISPPDAGAVVGGLVPRFAGPDSVLLAASMLGATVMPHAVYVHSALSRDRHHTARDTGLVLRATRFDVGGALVLAGAVNIGMLLLAASTLGGVQGTDTIAGAHAAVVTALGPVVGVLFALGLLASGLASTSVGCYAGAVIMGGLLRLRIPLLLRRALTLVPAIGLLAAGVDPTWALVISQVVLSFGIPFAVIPLLRYTGLPALMGRYRDPAVTRVLAWAAVALIVALNVVLLWLTVTGTAG
ncbi:divalent metal cation transporter [Tersicoccus phoenicis]|uniref:Divalent metal cation transporter n=1 Tax=Tersicoccus phoenicis TaxID=554083 RepID=A0A1R1L9B4_9MICC|nr:Nramp family divalent metal transporter [Tersicoccus phoenicis]OMH24122.1 divalent metal cation transporter [Tersicoccus phoenicis]